MAKSKWYRTVDVMNNLVPGLFANWLNEQDRVEDEVNLSSETFMKKLFKKMDKQLYGDQETLFVPLSKRLSDGVYHAALMDPKVFEPAVKEIKDFFNNGGKFQYVGVEPKGKVHLLAPEQVSGDHDEVVRKMYGIILASKTPDLKALDIVSKAVSEKDKIEMGATAGTRYSTHPIDFLMERKSVVDPAAIPAVLRVFKENGMDMLYMKAENVSLKNEEIKEFWATGNKLWAGHQEKKDAAAKKKERADNRSGLASDLIDAWKKGYKAEERRNMFIKAVKESPKIVSIPDKAIDGTPRLENKTYGKKLLDRARQKGNER